MRVVAVGAILLLAVSAWAQSLGELARAERERVKPRASRTITNDNLNGQADEGRPSKTFTNHTLTTKVVRQPTIEETETRAEAMSPLTGKYSPLPAPAVAPPPPPLTPTERELEHMRVILRGICADPRTENGQKLSEIDKATIVEGIKPLRARAEEFQRAQTKYKSALAALDKEFEARVLKTVNSEKPLTDTDLQLVKSLRQEHDTRRAMLVHQAESEFQAFGAWQKELETVGDECTEAANTVPD